MHLLRNLIVLAGLALGVWFGAHLYARYEIRTALVASGMSVEHARCVSRRTVRQLSLYQLWELRAFREEKHDLAGLRRAARKINDPHVVVVLGSSLALCSMGLAK